MHGPAMLQDAGRPGWRRFGVPTGGAFDRESWALSNALVGNDLPAASIEMALAGGMFRAESELICACVGAEAPIEVDGKPIPPQSVFFLAPGSTLEIGPFELGARCYLSAPGGFGADSTLGSVSGQSITRGDNLAHRPSPSVPARRLAKPPSSLESSTLRAVAGPQAEPGIFDQMASFPLVVSLRSDRHGVRLEGLPTNEVQEIPSEPACAGAIQATPSGELVIVGPDGPTIGGYPKIGVVCRADLDKVAQLRPGMAVRFVWIELEVARSLTQRFLEELEARSQQCATAADSPAATA